MQAMLDHSPSPACTAAVTDFATHMRLDPQALLGGQRFDCKGMGFRLDHHGPLDTDGVVLVLEIGEFAPGQDSFVCRRLLEHHLRLPVTRFGYYALAPGRDMVLYCLRIDVTQPHTHEAIAAAIETMSTGMEATLAQVADVLEEAARSA